MFLEEEKFSEEPNRSTIVVKEWMNPEKSPHHVGEQFFLFKITFSIFPPFSDIRIELFHLYWYLKIRNWCKVAELYLMFPI